MTQYMYLQYAAAPHPKYQDYVGRGNYGETTIIKSKEELASNVEETGEVVVMSMYPVIKHITVGKMECVPTKTLTEKPCICPQEECGLVQQSSREKCNCT